MTPSEFERWAQFYRRWPFDDRHRYHRPAALVAQVMGGGGEEAMAARLQWLQPGEEDPTDDEPGNADRDLLRAAGVRRQA